jgi:hypothetical protein
MNLSEMPSELIELITNNLNIYDTMSLKICNKELNRVIDINDYCYDEIKLNENDEYYNLNDIVSTLTDNIYDENEDDDMYILYPSTNIYRFIIKDYELVINRKVLYEIDNINVTSRYVYSSIIRKKNMKIPEYENFHYCSNISTKVSQGNLKMPALLFYLAIKVINNIIGYNDIVCLNYEINKIPKWIMKLTNNYEYPGYLLKQLINEEIVI